MTETKFNFTQDALEKMQCPPTERKQILLKDTRVNGLALRITPNGSKTYMYRRRLPSNNESPNKLCEIHIGKFDDLKLEQARNKAIEHNHLVGQEKDPAIERKPALTYGALFERYIDEYAKLHTVTWKEAINNYRRYFLQWENRSLTSIKRDQVQSWVNNLAVTSGKHTANRNYNTFRAVFTWAIGKGILLIDSPCIGIENPTLRDFFWMLLFTGARCSNVLSMEWSQVNMALLQWRIPITKNSDSQTIPLTISAMEILHRRKAAPDAHQRWVFPSDRQGWKTGELGHLVAPRKAFMRIVEKAGIEDLRIHDLRRTAGSYMAMQNVSPTIIGKALGHRSPQSTAIYARLTQDPVRQALENAQAALLNPEKLLPRNDNVISIQRKKKST